MKRINKTRRSRWMKRWKLWKESIRRSCRRWKWNSSTTRRYSSSKIIRTNSLSASLRAPITPTQMGWIIRWLMLQLPPVPLTLISKWRRQLYPAGGVTTPWVIGPLASSNMLIQWMVITISSSIAETALEIKLIWITRSCIRITKRPRDLKR